MQQERLALVAVLLAAAAVYAWAIASHAPLVAYDAEGHLHYLATIVDLGRIPAPLEGWSTFHPPLYYLVAALLATPTAPLWPVGLLEGASAAFLLLAGALAFGAARHLGHGVATGALATALLLLVPCTQLAATMLGNEALGALFAALAAVAGLRLQADPRSLRWAATAGLAVGLALATKFTGVIAGGALAVPYLRRDLDRRMLGAAALAAVVLLSVAAFPLARNVQATGEWLPMTRDREPVASIERSLTIRDRQVVDYLWFDPAIFRMPATFVVPGVDDAFEAGLNPVATNVWALAYASAWTDAHLLRVDWHLDEAARDGASSRGRRVVEIGRWLLVLGLLPTGLMLLGGVVSLRRSLAGRDPAAPLVGMAVLGALAFIGFTARAPTVSALKLSYLLPLAVPAVVFFARGLDLLPAAARRPAWVACAAAAIGSAVLFAPGVLLPIHRAPGGNEPEWMSAPVVAVAEDLRRASAGRWLAVRAEPMRQRGVRWRLTGRSFPPMGDDEQRVWCGIVGERMRSRAASIAWRAVIVQGNRRHRCPPTG